MSRRFRLPKSVEEIAAWYMHYVSPVSLVAGFLADNFFLAKRVDLLLTNALLFSYLIAAAVGIVFINLIQAGRMKHPFALQLLPLLPVAVQFAFGGLFSAYLSLYSRSASIAVSWIFVAAVATLLLLNERFSHFYSKFFVQIAIYFTVLFSFLIFFLPVIFHRIGPLMFLESGAVALVIMVFFLALLLLITPRVPGRLRQLVYLIGGIYLAFNVLYFTNAIPPLPLALKEAGVYHDVLRQADGSYLLTGEPLPWYEKFLNYAPTYHLVPGEPVYVWSAVFSPSGLDTQVLHRWQWYDEATRSWVTESIVTFPITGGRDGGYRGYSQKISVQPGSWRVDVLTASGQLIGRISFTVVNSPPSVPLVQRID